jgi:hypothetical protein
MSPRLAKRRHFVLDRRRRRDLHLFDVVLPADQRAPGKHDSKRPTLEWDPVTGAVLRPCRRSNPNHAPRIPARPNNLSS